MKQIIDSEISNYTSDIVKVVYPLKQGLKQIITISEYGEDVVVKVVYPLKQGLKHSDRSYRSYRWKELLK